MRNAGLLLVTCALFARPLAAKRSALRGFAGEDAAPAPGGSNSSGSGPVVVQLRRVGARHSSDDASFYIGNISVGTPAQHLEVLFDMASGHVLLPHKACKSPACLEHHFYSPWASSTAVDVNQNGEAVQKGHRIATGPVNRSIAKLDFTQSDLGEGSAKGVLVREHVCMSSCTKGREACADLAMLAATEEDYHPFANMPGDGIVGLGLEGLAVSGLSVFFPRLLDGSQGMLPEIGFNLGATGGEIVFGGRSPTAILEAPIEWFPVTRPSDGFWQVEILTVRVGGAVVDPCEGGCRGIIDTASSRLGVQHSRVEWLRNALASSHDDAGCKGPDVQLELQGGFALTLNASDYTGPGSPRKCEAELGSLNLEEPEFRGVYSLGTNVLRRYYAAFDWAETRVGFAPHAGHGSLRSEIPEVQSLTV